MNRKLKNILWGVIGSMLLGTGIYAGTSLKMSFEEAQQKKESRKNTETSGSQYQAMSQEKWKSMSKEEQQKYAVQELEAKAKKEAPNNLALLQKKLEKGKFHPADSQIIIGLSGAKEKKAVPVLLEILKGNYIIGIRKSAAEALGNIGDVAAHDELKKVLGDSDIQIKLEAAVALLKLGYSQEAFPVLEMVAKRQNTNHWNIDVSDQIDYSNYSETETEIKRRELIEDYKNSSLPSKAIRYLGEIGSKQALNVIESALNDPDKFVRLGAGSVLMETEKKEKAIPVLEDIVSDATITRSVRSAALSAIAKGNGDKEKGILIKYLKSDDDYLSKKAKKLIEKMEGK
ncbi:HEAT repeat domain-containing protein [candidate division FCPU426 bacterium]|nr:HEAT repeat domain-containing protein [candidate division FCPU426 bacterium]